MSSHMDKSFIPSDTTNNILQTDAKKTPSYSNSLQKTENIDQLLGIAQRTSGSTTKFNNWSLVFTWIPISSWARSADKGSPLRTGIMDEASGLTLSMSIRTEGLYTGCRAKMISFDKLTDKQDIWNIF